MTRLYRTFLIPLAVFLFSLIFFGYELTQLQRNLYRRQEAKHLQQVADRLQGEEQNRIVRMIEAAEAMAEAGLPREEPLQSVYSRLLTGGGFLEDLLFYDADLNRILSLGEGMGGGAEGAFLEEAAQGDGWRYQVQTDPEGEVWVRIAVPWHGGVFEALVNAEKFLTTLNQILAGETGAVFRDPSGRIRSYMPGPHSVPDQAVEAFHSAPDQKQILLDGSAIVVMTPILARDGTFLGALTVVRQTSGIPPLSSQELLPLVLLLAAVFLFFGVVLFFYVRYTNRTMEQLYKEKRESHAFLTTVFDSPPGVCICTLDKNLHYLAVNANYRRLMEKLGAAPGIPERLLMEGVSNELIRDRYRRRAEEAFEQGEPVTFVETLGEEDRRVTFENRVSPVFNRMNQVSGMVVFMIDISRRKDFEKALEQARKNAEKLAADASRANEAKSLFLANMSHEIRTPMNAVMGMTSLLLETELNPDQLEYARMIDLSAGSLLQIINDILDFSKIEAGKLDLEMIAFSPREMVDELEDLLFVKAAEKGLTLSAHVEEGVPAMVEGDPSRLRQILLNLGSNAVKFTSSGSVELRIRGDNGFLVLQVEDTGEGISPEKQGLLFQSFSQVDSSTTRRYGGTGLGLAITKGLVDLMEGSIAVESRPKEGSRFTVRLPLQPSSERDRLEPVFRDLRCSIHLENAQRNRELREKLEYLGARIVESGGDYCFCPISCGTLPEKPEREGCPVTVGMYSILESFQPAVSFDEYLRIPVRYSRLTALVRRRRGEEPEEKGPRGGAGIPRYSRSRVLVVEDNPINRRLAERMLEPLGCSVTLAEDGEEALQRAEERVWDIILMDLQMPRMDGLEATLRIREGGKNRETCIVAMTAFAMSGDQEACLRAGMDEYISKPIRKDVLWGVMAKHLTPSGEVSSLDPAVVERFMGDEALARQSYRDYAERAPRAVERIKKAQETGRLDLMVRFSHDLKGMARVLGFEETASAAQALEEGARSGESPPEDQFSRLEEAFRASLSEARAHLPLTEEGESV